MTKLRGEEYVDNLLSKEECEKRRQELASGMMVVHNYSKGLCSSNKNECIHNTYSHLNS